MLVYSPPPVQLSELVRQPRIQEYLRSVLQSDADSSVALALSMPSSPAPRARRGEPAALRDDGGAALEPEGAEGAAEGAEDAASGEENELEMLDRLLAMERAAAQFVTAEAASAEAIAEMEAQIAAKVRRWQGCSARCCPRQC